MGARGGRTPSWPHVDYVQVRLGVSPGDLISADDVDSFETIDVELSGSSLPVEAAHDAVRAVFSEALGMTDGYTVSTAIHCFEQGGSAQGVIITVAVLASVLATLPPEQAQRVAEGALEGLLVAAVLALLYELHRHYPSPRI